MIVVSSGDEHYEQVPGPGDLLSVPSGLYRQEINVAPEETMCVVLRTAQPLPPIMETSKQ